MPGPEPGVYLITALRGQGGPVGVVDLTEPSKPDPPMQPLSIVPRDSWHKWEVIRMPKGGGTYLISPISSAYMYTGVQDDNLVVATNGQGQDVEWELTGLTTRYMPFTGITDPRRGRWTQSKTQRQRCLLLLRLSNSTRVILPKPHFHNCSSLNVLDSRHHGVHR
ncbi:hypothetical protein BDP27DRAFT_1399017 [Rhodocollybia butyracea]|uniref:Uncharacterized protein n=1 Tax=Rhodocollybia butyracea TaxID=206335 RepID=A0A9P5Q5S9_9AGAR|nr:hypothetical protein BDP27DRAFT_1399017 [Rhodocollybia butyracea]